MNYITPKSKILDEGIKLRLNTKQIKSQDETLYNKISELFESLSYAIVNSQNTSKKKIESTLSFDFDEQLLDYLDQYLTVEDREKLSEYIYDKSNKQINNNKASDIYKLFIWEYQEDEYEYEFNL